MANHKLRRLPHVCRLLSIVVVLMAVLPAVALAADMGINRTAGYSDAQVRGMWQTLKPGYSGSPYVTAPKTSAPYAPGEVAAGFLSDGLNTINFARYLAGAPHDVVLDSVRNTDAQYGAVLLAASDFSHTPPKPAYMGQAFFNRGHASTSKSNIGRGYPTSWRFQLGCLKDEDAGNIDRVGHRRWLLNPRMAKTGIGFANSNHTTYAFDGSRGVVDYAAIAYPSAGPFPVDQGFFSSRTPWSLTLNPLRYDWDTSGHTITLRRVSDGKTWTFTAADTNKNGEFFTFDRGNSGVANCFIFRPDPASVSYKAGDQFNVTLSGGVYKEGTRTPTTVTYRTRFMTLASGDVVAPGPGPTADPAAKSTALTLTSKSNTKLGYGKAFKITGTLRCEGKGLAGRQVILQSAAPGKAFKDTKLKVTTDKNGVFIFSVKPAVKTSYKVRFAGVTGSYKACGPTGAVTATPKVSLGTPVAPKTMKRSKSYTVYGSLKPKHAKSTKPVRIYKYKKVGKKWVKKGYVKAKATNYKTYTRYKASVKLPSKGTWRLRAYAPADSKHAATWSAKYDTVKVK